MNGTVALHWALFLPPFWLSAGLIVLFFYGKQGFVSAQSSVLFSQVTNPLLHSSLFLCCPLLFRY